jgi:citrate lyase subunit beta/citryl-CoA lyase
VDGPFGDFRDDAGYREEARRARALGMVGKWAIHPSQIAPALEVFSPTAEAVAKARRIESAVREAMARGVGAVEIDGVMMDVAVLRLVRNVLDQADLYGL